MHKLIELNTKDIVAAQVFLEKRKTRIFVGELFREEKDGKISFHFEYDLPYLTNKAAIPLGPELPLTKEYYDSLVLFPSFQDRIPSRQNPAYIDYCRRTGISVKEKNPIVLLCTIGSRGPSSFIFEPRFKEIFTSDDLKNYRNELDLTIREFAALFNISPGHLQRIEAKIFPGQDILERIERYRKYPEDTLHLITMRGGFLHTNKKQLLIKKIIKELILSTYDELMRRQNNNLTDWQTIKIDEAIHHYKIEYYSAVIASLSLATEQPNKISQEPSHVKKLKEQAKKIRLEKEILEFKSKQA